MSGSAHLELTANVTCQSLQFQKFQNGTEQRKLNKFSFLCREADGSITRLIA